MTRFTRAAVLAAVAAAIALTASAAVQISERSGDICFASDSLPDHATGTFPNSGNPHSISAQSISFCVPADPQKGDVAQEVETIGIATNGVIIRPGTADYYDADSRRGFSRDPSSGWNLEAMGAGILGLDENNAHVDHRGLYHYHGVPASLTETSGDTLLGYAADGFEIHYIGSDARSSYMLLPGARDSAPGGEHDGTYVEDWTYVKGAGNLDACNGGYVDGTYTYFATDTYPFFPRCLYGTDITRIR